MTGPSTEISTSRLVRGHVAGLCGVGLVLVVLFYARGSWPNVVYEYLTDGTLLVVWLASAWGWGSVVRPSGRVEMRVLEGVSRIVVGLGVMGLVTLGLGLIGTLTRPTAAALLFVGALIGVVELVRLLRQTQNAFKDFFWTPVDQTAWLLGLCVPVVAIVTIAVLFPPGMLWKDEPNGYDVVAYHLQVPREWYELGRIVPLGHNVFSYFPFGLEMHDLLAIHLLGGAYRGMYLAQMMHAAFMGLAGLAVYGAVRSFASARNAILALVAFATTPYVPMLGAVAYNEAGLLLYGTLAFGWVLRIFESISTDETDVEKSSIWKYAMLAGVFAGLACGVKLTGAPVVLVSLAGIVGVALLVQKQFVRAIGVTVLFTLVGVVVFSPWLIKTSVWSGGNPVFPERMESLGQGHFTDDQVTRWRLAHSPREDQKSLPARMNAAWEQIGSDFRFGYVLIPLGVVSGVVAWRRTESRVLLAWLLLQFVFWIGFTHLQGRFFVLAVPTCAVLIGCVSWRRAFVAPVVLVVGAGAFGLLTLHGRMENYLTLDEQVRGPDGGIGLLGRPDLNGLNGVDVQQLPTTGDVVMVGDAKAFWMTVPTGRLHYRSVFDVVETPGASVVENWLGQDVKALPPGSVGVIDPDELRRLSRTYFKISGPVDEAHGVRVEPLN